MRPNESAPARILDTFIFSGLLVVLIFTAIPYGTVEPWSQAIFECAVFFLGFLWAIQGLFAGSWRAGNLSLFYPMFALVAFAIVQSLPWSQANVAGTRIQTAISADPFESWIFALRLTALTLAGVLAQRFTSTLVRLSVLVHTLIALAVMSGIFGIVRQATQHKHGFLLQFLEVGGGFGQFINRNHFAFLVEGALGLLSGISLLRRDRYDRLLFYLSLVLLLWVALVMSRSRGGLLAVTIQVICAALLFVFSRRRGRSDEKVRTGWRPRIAAITIAIFAMLLITVGGIVWLGGDQLTTGVETAAIEVKGGNAAHEGTRRVDIWRATWRMARAHPIAGAGLGGFWAEFPAYHDASGVQTPQQAHNDYLELLASGGLFAAAIFVWFAVLLFRRARRIPEELSGFQRGAALGALLGIAGIGVHSLVEFGLHITINALMFMILLAIVSLKTIDQRPIAQEHRNRAFN